MKQCKVLFRFAIGCAIPLAATGIYAQQSGASVALQPGSANTLRIWGDPAMASVVKAWEERFRTYHPKVHFETSLMGTDTAMAGLYGGDADIALLGRESNTTENDGFLHSLQYKPLQLTLMNGSLESPGKSYAPALFVHRGNPLRKLSLRQLDELLGCPQSRHLQGDNTWGALGLGGEWKDRPIHVYILDIESGTGAFVLRKLQGENKKLNWHIIREFTDRRHPDGTDYDAAEQAMDALRADPYGLAVSSLRYADEEVQPLALSASADSAFVAPEEQTIIDGTYPLARTTYAFVNRPPGLPVPALVRQFLQFVLSPEGQTLVARDGGFLPLSPQVAAQQALITRAPLSNR